jgi:hypothetical protein
LEEFRSKFANHNRKTVLRLLALAGVMTGGAVLAAAAFSSAAAAGDPYKKFVLQCAPRLATACPSGKHIVCVKRDGAGCCIRSQCHVN